MKYFNDVYGYAKPPVLGSFAIKEIEEKAREVMKDHLRECYHPFKSQLTRVLAAYMYTFGSAGTCSTDAANKRAFNRWKIVPAMLKDCTNRNVEVSIHERVIPLSNVFLHLGRQRFLGRSSTRLFSSRP
jgi:lactate 2-monooxygenase